MKWVVGVWGGFSFVQLRKKAGWLHGLAYVCDMYLLWQSNPPLLSCHAAKIDSHSRWWFLGKSRDVTLRVLGTKSHSANGGGYEL